jgi:3-dehydroquinate synthase
MNSKSNLKFSTIFPKEPKVSTNSVLLYDKRVLRSCPAFKIWKGQFEFARGIDAGETAKTFETYQSCVLYVLKSIQSGGLSRPRIIAVGGGSVGDLAGFLASTVKRGLPLWHMPSTWLSAIDSAHGGKSALNVGGYKNQVGTFYPAEKVLIVKELLYSQPMMLAKDALSELAKICLIKDEDLWSDIVQSSTSSPSDIIYKYLKRAIEAKMSIVAQDPFEQTGIRQILNLGHTAGHVFEACYGWSHGYSVGQGLLFSLDMSLKKGALGKAIYQEIVEALESKFFISKDRVFSDRSRMISIARFSKYLSQDKKSSGPGKVTFIVLESIGAVRRLDLSIEFVSQTAREFGWVK